MPAFTIDDVQRRLEEFSSADEIAAQFAILRIYGEPKDSGSCPIANVIHNTCRPEYDDEVSAHQELISDGSDTVRTPLVAVDFMQRFDDFKYPEIVEER